jgi:predicted RNA-binding Zn-ribbon protein involved in translation (DUF1610 family)
VFRRPRCPNCRRPLSFLESYRARVSRFPCPGCGASIKIPATRQFVLAVPLFLVFRTISNADWDLFARVGVIVALAALVIIIEYLTVSMITYRREDPGS